MKLGTDKESSDVRVSSVSGTGINSPMLALLIGLNPFLKKKIKHLNKSLLGKLVISMGKSKLLSAKTEFIIAFCDVSMCHNRG